MAHVLQPQRERERGRVTAGEKERTRYEERGERGDREREREREKKKVLKMKCKRQKCTEKLGTMMLRKARLISLYSLYHGNSETFYQKKVRYHHAWRSNADLIFQWNEQNTKELRTTASEIAAPKPDLDAKAAKRRF